MDSSIWYVCWFPNGRIDLYGDIDFDTDFLRMRKVSKVIVSDHTEASHLFFTRHGKTPWFGSKQEGEALRADWKWWAYLNVSETWVNDEVMRIRDLVEGAANELVDMSSAEIVEWAKNRGISASSRKVIATLNSALKDYHISPIPNVGDFIGVLDLVATAGKRTFCIGTRDGNFVWKGKFVRSLTGIPETDAEIIPALSKNISYVSGRIFQHLAGHGTSGWSGKVLVTSPFPLQLDNDHQLTYKTNQDSVPEFITDLLRKPIGRKIEDNHQLERVQLIRIKDTDND